jgi:hypothetical protein
MRICVKDNDELIIVANVDGATVQDPVNATGAIARLFRVVASKMDGGTLSLTPISEPAKIASEDFLRMIKELEKK